MSQIPKLSGRALGKLQNGVARPADPGVTWAQIQAAFWCGAAIKQIGFPDRAGISFQRFIPIERGPGWSGIRRVDYVQGKNAVIGSVGGEGQSELAQIIATNGCIGAL